MPEMIKQIRAEIQTATQERASRTVDWNPATQSTSEVYLGIAGREFRCNTDQADFEAGKIDIFLFGGDANVTDANINDPQNIALAAVMANPVYIRFDQRGTEDAWCLERAEVRVSGAGGALHLLVAPLLDGDDTLWLSTQSGFQVYLSA
jgi:hypothetical protein